MKISYPTLLRKSIYSLLICIGALSSLGASESRMSLDDLLKIDEQRLSETPAEIIEQSVPNLSYSNDDLFLDRIQTLAYTFPYGIINNGQKLQLIDESIWAINSVQSYRVRNWVQAQTVFIKPNASCFSRYNYVLYNRDTREAVEAQFVSMPENLNFYRQRIEKLDPYNRVIQLDDAERTVWAISMAETGFGFWSVGDYIIVGVNNDWRIAKYPHILINASISQGPYCEATFKGYGL